MHGLEGIHQGILSEREGTVQFTSSFGVVWFEKGKQYFQK
jgi:hypothetical protein